VGTCMHEKRVSHRNSLCCNLNFGLLGRNRGICHKNQDSSKQIKEEGIQTDP
jgi:hypothetical protein